ncbi:MAG: cobalamin B12-binding domain-containing protein [Ardenticatenaceae bacterium]|nr:cobalamin B12-binding domain-containing protein [Ardenticatenaceae bacterium]MCB8949408.1 cobalamin B12-binding domain-containing protein [Ardenticatenaceae bacterium]
MSDPHPTESERQILIAHVADLNENEALALVEERVAQGQDPLAIIEDCQEGLRQVGERYERQEYYLSGLIMAGEIFREVMEIVQPIIVEQFTGKETGTILLGTVRGDIHDIGKNNLSMLLTCYGFSVHDLGVDVPPSEFLLQAIQVRPDIIGLSGLLTSSYDAMKETIDLIRMTGDPEINSIPIVIGGNQLNDQVSKYVGADYWLNDAMSGVRLCQQLLHSEQQEN